jgi:hypothetical protein
VSIAMPNVLQHRQCKPPSKTNQRKSAERQKSDAKWSQPDSEAQITTPSLFSAGSPRSYKHGSISDD